MLVVDFFLDMLVGWLLEFMLLATVTVSNQPNLGALEPGQLNQLEVGGCINLLIH